MEVSRFLVDRAMSNLVNVVGSEKLKIIAVREGTLLDEGGTLFTASSSWVTARTTPDGLSVLEVDHTGRLTSFTSLGGIDVAASS